MKIVKIFLILFFMVFISSAAIQYYFPVVKVKVVNENRTKVEWPHESVWVGVRDGAGYSIAVERFFSDNFPLRDFMLRSLGQFEYSLLGRSREVIIGKDGWLSDKKVLAEHLHQLDRADDEQIKVSVIQLKRLQYWLQGRGIEFLMVIVPMKPTIYPEKYPEINVQRPVNTGLQRFQMALGANDIPFLDVLSLLNEHKNEMPLYYKTDMHWNTVATSYAAEAIVNHFSCRLLRKKIWNERILKSEQELSGGELTVMPLLYPRAEITPIWQSADPGYGRSVVGEIEIYSGTDKTRALLPPSIMFGNSFMINYSLVGFNNYFVESSRVLDYQSFSKVMDYIKPEHKIFILHIYETQLLFHVMPTGSLGYWSGSTSYWDKRILDLPLPVDFEYKQ